ncbi:MAG: hypothetical protein IPK93_08855 [Solirubrobacterales bacterium]|nr:hypothetical protein [Solirubrobacterales bacterium]
MPVLRNAPSSPGGYPWARPLGSFVLTEGEGELLAGMDQEEQHQVIDRFSSSGSERSPILAIGANASPDGLWIKFGHFPDAEDRTLLALTGHLHDFDIAATAELAPYGALPATLVPSPGTAVEAATLWVTDNQLTQLAWAEIPYFLGRIRTRFLVEAPLAEHGIADADELLAFVSRIGAFCPGGDPLALAAIPAVNRQAEAMPQVELLDLVSTMTFGEGHTAETLLRGLFEDPAETQPPVSKMLDAHAIHFDSEQWTPFGAEEL